MSERLSTVTEIWADPPKFLPIPSCPPKTLGFSQHSGKTPVAVAYLTYARLDNRILGRFAEDVSILLQSIRGAADAARAAVEGVGVDQRGESTRNGESCESCPVC